jgi:hypothetical protein
MSPDSFRKEIEVLLRAGPSRWAKTVKSLSEEVQFLARPESVSAAGSYVVADYFNKCSPQREGWPEFSRMVRHAHELLCSQYFAAERWKTGLDPDLVDAFPAVEIIVAIAEEEPAGWRDRWERAGGKMITGRSVAMKASGVLQRFGDFGHPFEPFDWSGSLSVEDIDDGEAERLGLR